MPVFLVVYSSIYDNTFHMNIKTIHRVIPTTTARAHLETALDKCKDLLHSTVYPGFQWELVLKPENKHLEEMVGK